MTDKSVFLPRDLPLWEEAKGFLDVRNNDEHTVVAYALARALLVEIPQADESVVLPAILLSVPLTSLVGTVIGSLSFRVPLVLTLSPGAALVWASVVAIGSLLASAVPADRAARMPVRAALAYA